MADRYWVGAANANWDATAGTKWSATSGGASGASVPTAIDNVFFDASSPAVIVTLTATSVARSIDFTGFTGTFNHPTAINMSIGDPAGTAPASNIAVKFVAGMTYTRADNTSAFTYVGTTATAQAWTSGGKQMGNFTINAAGGKLKIADTMLVGSTGTVTLTAGTLDTNDQACSWGSFSYGSASATAVTFGASAITVTGGGSSWTFVSSAGNTTVTANTATVTMTGAGARFNGGSRNWNGLSVVLSGSGTAVIDACTVAALTRSGTAVKTDAFTMNANVTVTGTCTFGGGSTQGVNRLVVQSNAINTQRTITAAAYVITGDVNFMDMNLAYSGAASWTNTGNAWIGDCGGNAGAVTTNVTASVSQASTGTASFTWSTHGWTTRVPLPQDDVSVPNAFVASRVITMDMPCAGRNLIFSCTGSPTFTPSLSFSFFGSLDTTGIGTSTVGFNWTVAGRGAYTIAWQSGLTVTGTAGFIINAPGGTYTLQDNNLALGAQRHLVVTQGALNSNGKNVTAGDVQVASGATLTMGGAGTWTLSATGATTVWNMTTSATLNTAAGTTIAITATDAFQKIFAGGSKTYGTLQFTPTGLSGLQVTGNNTFGSVNFQSTSGKTVAFDVGGTTIVTGASTIQGASGQTLTIDSADDIGTTTIIMLGTLTRAFYAFAPVVVFDYRLATATINAASTVSGVIGTGKRISVTTISATSTVSGSLGYSRRNLATAQVSATSTVSGIVGIQRKITGSITASVTVGGNVVAMRQIATGQISATSIVSGSVVEQRKISGIVNATSTMSGRVNKLARISATINATTTASGTLTARRAIRSGLIISAAASTGFTVALRRVGPNIINASSTITGRVVRVAHITSVVSATSTVSGRVVAQRALKGGAITATSTVSGAVVRIRQAAQGQILAASVVSGTITAKRGIASNSILAYAVVTGTVRGVHNIRPLSIVSASSTVFGSAFNYQVIVYGKTIPRLLAVN